MSIRFTKNKQIKALSVTIISYQSNKYDKNLYSIVKTLQNKKKTNDQQKKKNKSFPTLKTF